MEDMTDKAIGWIGQQKALIPTSRSSSTSRRRDARAASRAQGMGDKYKGKFDRAGTRCARRPSRARRSSA
jgi:arylsulfatase